MRSSLLKAALEYADRGWAVFPLDGKRPFSGTRGHLDATTKRSEIRSWWDQYPDANVGIRCDSVNGPIVLDQDGPEGAISLASLRLPPTLEATSGRKDRKHFYFDPCDQDVARRIKVRPGLDILGDGGYVVAPPSIHPRTGRPYRWLNDLELAPFPKVLFKLLSRNGKKVAPPLPEIIGEGQRDTLLTSLAGTMRRRGASEEAILAALLEENDYRCRPPLPEAQIVKIAKSIAQKTPAPVIENLTDLGNARRFIVQHHQNLKYVKVWKRPWAVWDGIRWAIDDTGEVERLAKNTVRDMARQAGFIEDDDTRENLIKHAMRSEASNRVRAMLDLAATEPEIVMMGEAFDANPWLFNTENGTLNLKNGELRPPKRDDMLTKISPIIYDPHVGCPTWLRFLKDITRENRDLIAYLQRAVGYSLTADVREQCLFFCWGTGQNGKSTFLEVIRAMMGDYAQQADFSSFLSRKGEGPRNDLARMRGTRFVSAVEAPGDKSFDEAVLKQLTGGDTVTARRLYEEYFEFKPTHKIWLAANHKPHVTEQTEAFWRRIRLIPFNVYIPPEKRDRKLKDKLLRELSGIMNWALAGCLEWQRVGLGEPAAVKEATTSYREEEDVIGEFLAMYCKLNPDAWTNQNDAYQSFSTWWRETRGVHVRPPMPRWFTRAMTERHNIRTTKKSGVRGYRGIALKVKIQ